ncbi:outer membrane protein assembly factor BamA [Rhodobacteraceae bacterium CCMM004]|nr:outer membrane protein assembly factor BamA [Rhodobacteraceae bacterium CCMM004]
MSFFRSVQMVQGRVGARHALWTKVRAHGLMALLALGLVVAVTAPAAWAQSFRFTNVVVEGNTRVDPGTIVAYANLPSGEAVSGGRLNDAYQGIVNSGLFETVELVPSGNTLVIRVVEWPTINRISIEGNRRIEDDDLFPLIESQPRRVYSPTQAEEDAANIAGFYEAQGRLAATVTPRIIRRSENRVDLVFEIAEGRVVETERVSFVGNRAFSDSRLRRVLDTKQAGLLRQFVRRDTFVADRLQLDRQLLSDFYASRGYVDFRVLSVNSEFARERNAFFVTFNVQEGQSFDFGQITAATDLDGIDTAEFLAVSRIRPGRTYNPAAVENTIARMERLATDKGLTFVRVDPRIDRDDRNLVLNVEFFITRGPRVFVERIDIEGNATTLDRVIRRQFRTVEGDPFNPREIRAAAERIRALGYFGEVDVESREGTSSDQVVIDVDVEEQPTGTLSFGGSYSPDGGPGVNISFTERNFLGRGQTLRFGVTTGTDNSQSNFTFIEPYFLGRDLTARFDAFYNTSQRDNSFYDTRRVGISPSLEFPVGENSRLSLNYALSKDAILNVDRPDPTIPGDTGSSPILVAEEGARWTSSVGYQFSYDTRRTGLNPNAGVLLRFGQDFAGLGGDNEYLKTEALAIAQTRVLNEEVTLRATLEGGAIHALSGGTTRVIDRYFLSTNQLRGFAPLGIGPRDLAASNRDTLGGNYYVSARLEAEFPLGLPEEYGITGGVFFDAGSVWGLDNVVGQGGTIVDDSFNLRSSVGISIFWTTPIGPLRFNFAKPLSKESYDEEQTFNLTVSTQF